MAIVSKLALAALAGLFVANFATSASAQGSRARRGDPQVRHRGAGPLPERSDPATSATARILHRRAWGRRASDRELTGFDTTRARTRLVN